MSRFSKFLYGSAFAGTSAYLTSWLISGQLPFTDVYEGQINAAENPLVKKRTLPPRNVQIESLKKDHFDVLIIGGGASGAGCALDAATRGLKTALIEQDDFASGTSSRSTKLIHGGVRYLQKAIMNGDIEQYNMVREALNERAFMLDSAPHLTHLLPIMVPVYKWWQVPYFWVGMKMYDAVAGFKNLRMSFFMGKKSALDSFPMLKNDKLCGAIIYYDGMQDDARMCLAIALTATRHGATVANHIKATSLLKDEKGHCCGAKVKDEITGEEWECKAKCIVNATGPYTDTIRKMDNPSSKRICSASSGTHIVLPGYYSPEKMGLLDPSTKDGRVIFFLPWQKHTIAGTTDVPCAVTHHPMPTENEILFILEEIKHYLSQDVEVRRGDVLSAWCGIRPLVSDPNKPDTQSLARNHIVHVSDSRMITIAGGKWTTYRSMAKDTVDAAINAVPELKPTRECVTEKVLIEGAHGWSPTMYIRLVQDFGLESEVAQHLSDYYGDRAFAVAKLASHTGQRWPIIGKKIHPEFPYIDAEIRYGVREYAMTAVDMIARRLRLSFLNVQAAKEALPCVINIMAEELKWSEKEKKKQHNQALEFLVNEMGDSVNRASKEDVKIDLTNTEVQTYVERFRLIDQESKGYISINDMRRSFKNYGDVHITGEELHSMLREIDTNMNGQVELDEYLQMMAAIKAGHMTATKSRFARMAESEHERAKLNNLIPVERSGGGL